MLLHFIGQRRREFTLDSPTFIQNDDQSIKRYLVNPDVPLEVPDADAKALLKRDPHLWSVEPKPAEAEAPALTKLKK